MEETLLMIKPDAVGRNLTGRILARVEASGLALRRLKLVHLSADEARAFYRVHAGKPFLDDLAAFIAGGPVCAAVFGANDAVARLRRLVGATDPLQAAPNTLRRDFGTDVRRNAVHASDSRESAAGEVAFFGLGLARDARFGGTPATHGQP
jgi:nucleoside-diphosphate kinase